MTGGTGKRGPGAQGQERMLQRALRTRRRGGASGAHTPRLAETRQGGEHGARKRDVAVRGAGKAVLGRARVRNRVLQSAEHRALVCNAIRKTRLAARQARNALRRQPKPSCTCARSRTRGSGSMLYLRLEQTTHRIHGMQQRRRAVAVTKKGGSCGRAAHRTANIREPGHGGACISIVDASTDGDVLRFHRPREPLLNARLAPDIFACGGGHWSAPAHRRARRHAGSTSDRLSHR